MNALTGNYSLAAAALAAAVAIIASIAAVRFSSRAWLNTARLMIVAVTAFLGVASYALLTALIDKDFSLAYVAKFTEKALPLGYKLAAFWAGQEGSMLLWALLLAVMSLIVVLTRRRDELTNQAAVIGALAAVIAFFICVMLFVTDKNPDLSSPIERVATANPFQPAEAPPDGVTPDGQGLNPLLQNPWMIAHPPMLFLGYATFTIPFAFLFASLATGRRDGLWVNQARRWVMAAWLFLGIGIILGSVWAYVELNWGGYWGWDPVENASLLPWLAATALVHSLIAQQQRGMFKRWTAILATLSFVLCIFAAWVTRSGLIQSVHAFAPSAIGWVLLVFMLAVAAGMVGLIIARSSTLRSERSIEAIISREGAVLACIVLLLLMIGLTMYGMLAPLIPGAVETIGQTLERIGPRMPLHEIAHRMVVWANRQQPSNYTAGYYNVAVLPLALMLAAVMGIAPALTYGGQGPRLQKLLAPAAGAPVPAAVVVFLGLVHFAELAKGAKALLHATASWDGAGATRAMGSMSQSLWILSSAIVVGLVAGGIVGDIVRSVIDRVRGGENALMAIIRMLDGNHRRYGGWVVHAGVGLMVAGIAGSSLFKVEQTLELDAGQSAKVGRYTLTFHTLKQFTKDNYQADEAFITADDGSGQIVELRPQVRRYMKFQEQVSYIIALNTNVREDLHLSFLGATRDDGTGVALRAVASPMVLWLWIGGIVLIVGGIFCLIPSFLPQRRLAESLEPDAYGADPQGARPALDLD